MSDKPQLMEEVYELVLRVYSLTETFPDQERLLLGAQLRATALSIASDSTVGETTDDPAEQQITLRDAAMACVRFELLLRLTRDMKHATPSELDDAGRLVDEIKAEIARVRRTYHPE